MFAECTMYLMLSPHRLPFCSTSFICRRAVYCLQPGALAEAEHPRRHLAAKQPGHTNCLSVLLAASAICGQQH